MDLHHVRETLSALDADLSKSSFDDVNLAGATFTNAKLAESRFNDVNLAGATFTNATLAKARFDDVNLAGATFTNTNLAGLTCVDVNLEGASISDANLTGMRINGILVEDLLRAYRSAGAVVYAKDVARLEAFYQNVLGFELEAAQRDHAVLVSPALRLTIVAIPAEISSSIEISEPPRLRSESPTKLVFPTTSIASARASARNHGGEVLPVEREWEFGGSRVCDGNDPEGNVIQLREHR